MTERQRIAVTRLAEAASRRLISNHSQDSIRLSRSDIKWALDGMPSEHLPMEDQTVQLHDRLWRIVFGRPALMVHRLSGKLKADER